MAITTILNGTAKYATSGVGDTAMVALRDLFEAPAHWLHLGLGFYAQLDLYWSAWLGRRSSAA